MERGPSNTTLADIAARANCSKRAIYTHLGSKEKLLIGIIEMRAKRLNENLLGALSTEKSAEEALFDYVKTTMEITHARGHIGIMQAIFAEMRHLPDLGSAYWDIGPGEALTGLVEFLRTESERGVLSVDDPHRAAQILLGMTHWPQQMKRLCSAVDQRSKRQIHTEAKRVTSDFMRLFAPNR